MFVLLVAAEAVEPQVLFAGPVPRVPNVRLLTVMAVPVGVAVAVPLIKRLPAVEVPTGRVFAPEPLRTSLLKAVALTVWAPAPL